MNRRDMLKVSAAAAASPAILSPEDLRASEEETEEIREHVGVFLPYEYELRIASHTFYLYHGHLHVMQDKEKWCILGRVSYFWGTEEGFDCVCTPEPNAEIRSDGKCIPGMRVRVPAVRSERGIWKQFNLLGDPPVDASQYGFARKAMEAMDTEKLLCLPNCMFSAFVPYKPRKLGELPI